MSEFVERIMAQSNAVRSRLAQDATIGQWVDMSLQIPQPFHGTGDIRLFIIGQDPTVDDPMRRKTITTVLTLNEPGSRLRRFITTICDTLGIVLDENVYATNAAKNFFKDKPSTLLTEDQVDVLEGSKDYWLPILRTELAAFPSAVVISLGEPVLSMLVKLRSRRFVKDYWGHSPHWRQGERKPLGAIESDASTVDREIFPVVHLPTLTRGRAKPFYTSRWGEYLAFIKEDMKYGSSH